MKNCYLFSLSAEQTQVLRSMDVITCDDVKKVMQSFSSGKIKNVKVGKLHIVNAFFPLLKDSPITKQEGLYGFYALEKKKDSFFSKPNYRVFVWTLGSETIFSVATEAVTFNAPDQDATEKILLEEKAGEHAVCRVTAYGREHECFFEKMQLYRKYAVEGTQMTCTKDYALHYFRWTNPDPWVGYPYIVRETEKPMFYLRNVARQIPGYSVQISYPNRPALFGWEIDE